MDKGDRFLWAVQTMLLSEQVKLATNPDVVERSRSDLGPFLKHDITIGVAMYVAENDKIPEDMTAFQAAYEYCSRALNDKLRLPNWALDQYSSKILEHQNIFDLSDELDKISESEEEGQPA